MRCRPPKPRHPHQQQARATNPAHTNPQTGEQRPGGTATATTKAATPIGALRAMLLLPPWTVCRARRATLWMQVESLGVQVVG